jgi:hypothetical protein
VDLPRAEKFGRKEPSIVGGPRLHKRFPRASVLSGFFGSFERGNYAPGSDVDLFIVLREADCPVRDRIPQLMPASFPAGVDLFPFTRQEMRALAPSPLLDAVAASRWRYAC